MKIKILNIEKKETNKQLSTKLRLPLGTKVYCLQRLRIIDDEPVSVDRWCCSRVWHMIMIIAKLNIQKVL